MNSQFLESFQLARMMVTFSTFSTSFISSNTQTSPTTRCSSLNFFKFFTFILHCTPYFLHWIGPHFLPSGIWRTQSTLFFSPVKYLLLNAVGTFCDNTKMIWHYITWLKLMNSDPKTENHYQLRISNVRSCYSERIKRVVWFERYSWFTCSFFLPLSRCYLRVAWYTKEKKN